MRTRLGSWCCAAVMVLSGCGGAAAKHVAQAPPATGGWGEGDAAKTMSSEAPASPAEYAPPAAATGAGPSADSARAEERSAAAPRQPIDRPGLGTEWGETRESPVNDVTFFRADDQRPFAVATLHYDDREGVEALARSRGGAGDRLRELPARGGALTVSIRGDYGQALDALHVGGSTYVMGEAGGRYSILLTNHTPHRFEAVATVDGLDVINGHAGGIQNRGYVLMPYGSLEIDGFRQSKDAVAAFRFGRVADSYAAQTGSARNVGVIGVAFFAERGDHYDDDNEVRIRETANPFPAGDPRFARPPRSR